MHPALTENYARTLVIDAGAAQGAQLTEQLNHAGFGAEFVGNWRAAQAALGANGFNSCIVVADLDQVEDRKQLSQLRRVATRTWIIVLCDLATESAVRLARRQGVDAVLAAPIYVFTLRRDWLRFRDDPGPCF